MKKQAIIEPIRLKTKSRALFKYPPTCCVASKSKTASNSIISLKAPKPIVIVTKINESKYGLWLIPDWVNTP
ncbi:MAG: hypothetical protein KAI53_04060, partial [Candidatus Aenigmarchaeota archaeon]|nr:hypothetical protein [Candidatus Aenigmarchaeota archaeon]